MLTRTDTRVEMTDIVLPGDTNHHATIFGGKVMSMIDICGAISAAKFCRMPVVTAAVDNLHFTAPIKTGQVIKLVGHVNEAFDKSLEVEVNVTGEDLLTGETWSTCTAFLTFVAVIDGKTQTMPHLGTKTSEDLVNKTRAKTRRQQRLESRKQLEALV